MAEGLQEAVQAFHTEINPEARPRDDSGRFAAAARPETMFAPRPVEGDPLTGDTSDGGDDPRFAATERRVADGRAEEGDEQSLQNRARPRDAAGDGRHERTGAQPERVGGEGELDPNAQKPDGGRAAEGEGDGEGASEQDADGQEWQVSVNGKPVEKLEVIVDGKPHEVTLQEALKGYVDGETYSRRVAQVGEAVKVIQQTYATASQARDQYIQQLQNHEEDYAALLPKEPDWDAFYAQDPRTARETQKNFQAAMGKLYDLRQRRVQAIQEREQENARQVAEYARNGFEEFKRNSRISPDTFNNELAAMRRAGLEYGFNEQELSTTYDPRMLTVLLDASLYRRALAAKPRPVVPDKGRTLAPGAARPIGAAARKGIDDAQRQLAKTGKLDDATVLFQRLIK
jgi:hypothetical protein